MTSFFRAVQTELSTAFRFFMGDDSAMWRFERTMSAFDRSYVASFGLTIAIVLYSTYWAPSLLAEQGMDASSGSAAFLHQMLIIALDAVLTLAVFVAASRFFQAPHAAIPGIISLNWLGIMINLLVLSITTLGVLFNATGSANFWILFLLVYWLRVTFRVVRTAFQREVSDHIIIWVFLFMIQIFVLITL